MLTKTTNSRKKSLAEAIRAAAKERRKEYRESNSWLRSAAWFDHNLRLSPEKQAISSRLLDDLMKGQHVRKRTQKKLDFEVLCANLLYHEQHYKFFHRTKVSSPVAISLSRKNWTANRYSRLSYFTMDAVALLSENKLIKKIPGYGHKITIYAQRTKIWPTKKLLETFKPVRMEDFIFDPVELVILRDKNKKPIYYRDTKEIKHVREILRKANMVNDQALVQYVDPESREKCRLKTRLHCVYNVDFKHGGRFYTSEWDGYQQFSEEERKHIHINHKPTVELDFSGLHPRLLYAWEDIQYNDDPYSAVVKAKPLRPIIKNLFLILLNSDDEAEAVRAGNKLLKDNNEYYLLLRKHGLTVKGDLIPMFKEAHKPISKYFCTGVGLKAMNTDSKIALDVITDFANDSIPILAIHDTFIVQHKYKRRLRKVMHFAYREQTGGFRCKIKLPNNY